MIRTYFQMLVDEIAVDEAAEALRTAAILASGQTAREQRHRDAVGKMKQFAAWFTHGVPGGGALRKQIFEAKNGHAVLDAVEAFFARRSDVDSEALQTQDEMSLEALGAGCD
jgi:tRNA-dihydrouridine synthase